MWQPANVQFITLFRLNWTNISKKSLALNIEETMETITEDFRHFKMRFQTIALHKVKVIQSKLSRCLESKKKSSKFIP